MTNIFTATKSYENWLARQCQINKSDLKLKHAAMRETPFQFLRATFYRWMQLWRGQDATVSLRQAPKVLAIGDLHIENFGTWRDTDGRLIWGVNDFDEAFPLPYTLDLVRLGVSIHLAIDAGELRLKHKAAIQALLDGYGRALHKGPQPFVLEEEHGWLRDIALSELREPFVFWRKLSALPTVRNQGAWRRPLLAALPAHKGLQPSFRRRTAGLGSLGRTRVVALADCGGGLIAREAKALAPSACVWAADSARRATYSQRLVEQAVRVRDPLWQVRQGWVVRRLAPHCCKIDLSHLPKRRSELHLLDAMGFDCANIHLGDAHSRHIRQDFTPRRRREILDVIFQMQELVLSDWHAWRTGV